MARQRTLAPGIVARPRYMYAKFAGNCKCGKRINTGDLMCYDPATRHALCVPCAKRRTKLSDARLTEVEPCDEVQELLDHINRLRALPTPMNDAVIEQISRLELQLHDYARGDWAVRLRLLRASLSSPLIAIAARYSGKCSKCGREQSAGEPVAYDTENRKIYCYACS